ncbi:MAG: redoxin domain-containing protein [Cyanobacteria bacterium J06554_11]
MKRASYNFRGLLNRRFVQNFMPVPAISKFPIGHLVPDFSLTDVDGKVHRLIDYRNQPIVLAFTRIFTEHQYCPLCYPHILAMAQAYGQFVGLGAVVLMITSTDQSQSKIVRQDLDLQLPLLVDSGCAAFRQYGTGQALGAPLPAQFVLDQQGRLQFQHLFSFAHPNATPERLLWAIRNLQA